MGGTVYRLSACLLFIVYLPDIYEFTFYTFYCSNMLLSMAYFAWGRVIIYDDNLSCRSLSQAKRKIYIFLLSFFERKTVATCLCTRFVRDLTHVLGIKNHPEQFALCCMKLSGTKESLEERNDEIYLAQIGSHTREIRQ